MQNKPETPVVLLVNGEFPSHQIPLEILQSANTVVCTDGSANNIIKKIKGELIIIGDFDSLKIGKKKITDNLIHLNEQNTTDFEKSLIWCLNNKINNLVILGSSGLREDHSIANYFLFCKYSLKLKLKMFTNHFTITSHLGFKKFRSKKGQIVSIFATKENTSITSTSLKYPLNNFILNPSAKAISNESQGNTFTLKCNQQVIVFRGYT